MKLALIRPPQQSYYNDLDLREDNLISYFLGYCEAQNLKLDFSIFDFVLDKSNSVENIIRSNSCHFVIFVRETGSAPHYAIRICKKLIDNEKRVTLYGQVERLKKIDILRHEKVKFIEQNEKALINYIFPDFKVDDNITFNSGFSVKPYFDQCNIIESRMPLFKVALEGTRGCEFKCKFCYINCNNQEIVQKWDVRSIRSILQDISIYYNLGFRLFVFMDSEFIGRSRARDNEIKELSENIKEMFPDIRFMIYARADTISKCTALENLKDAGLINIFIGVESFFQNDLTNLKKGIRSENLISCLKSLLNMNIYMTLSFITFNRYTTTKSLRFNIETLKELHKLPNSKYLGMPNFIFNMESSWNDEGKNVLSNKTYIKWLLYYKSQPGKFNAIFDTKLEPLMEIYRVLHYEVTKKIAELNYESAISDRNNFSIWFEKLSLFSLNVMDIFLYKFENGKLTIDNLPENIQNLYDMVYFYNKKTLPSKFINLLTYDETIRSYSSNSIKYLSHGWDNNIPTIGDNYEL